MNICFFNWKEYTPDGVAPGGVERATALLAKELRRRGHCVEFYYSPKPKLTFLSSFLPSFLPSSRYFESARFCKFLREHKTDVAVRHAMHLDSHLLLKRLPCKLVMVQHGRPPCNAFSAESYSDHFIKKRKIKSRIGQRIVRSKLFSSIGWGLHDYRHVSYDVRRSDKYVLLSKGFFSDFPPSKKFPQKICAIPNIATFRDQNVAIEEKKKELLWVGRITFEYKRPDLMLHIWKLLQDRFSDWKLRFVGDGDYLSKLKELSSSLGLKNVFFEGFQDPASYYRSAPIFCMTSEREGFGMVLVEAQAFGCVPVVFDSYSTVREIVDDDVSGIIVPAFDINKYAERLSKLMLDPALRLHIALNARKSVSRFSPEKIGGQWEKLFQEVLEKDKNYPHELVAKIQGMGEAGL